MFRSKEAKNAEKNNRVDEGKGKIVEIFKHIFHAATLVSSFDLKLSFFGNQIKASSGGLSAKSSESATATEEISSSMTEVVSANETLASSLQQIAKEAESLNKNTMESNRLLQDISMENQEMIAFSEHMQHSMGELSEVVSKISQVILGINQISSQTKLLSLNASIEAARAGEAGKGFSVVAGEISTLSESTRALTVSIDELLHTMQGALNESKASVEHAISSISNVGKGVESVTAMMQRNSDSVEHITDSISGAAASGEQVNAALQESSSALEMINSDLQEMADSAAELDVISHSINEISASVQAIEGEITNLAMDSGKLVNSGQYPLSNEDFIHTIRDAIQAHTQWVDTVSEMASSMQLSPIQTDEHKCGFGHFYFAVRPAAQRLSRMWDDIDSYHHDIHHKGDSVIDSIKSKDQSGAIQAALEARTLSEQIINLFEKIIIEVQNMSRTNEAVF
ncbi:methyl-accepting chemotaxis protein [Aminipila luticellarii]|nr:methyl-accepting chemotaxis protein [Aminipila luticellarii]